MGAAIDMIGRRYGKLTVVGRAENRNNIRYWRCHCDCGAEILTQGGPLRWQCRHGTNPENRCPWTTVDYERMQPRFEPVPGWTAERIKYNGAETYTIKACPLFERG